MKISLTNVKSLEIQEMFETSLDVLIKNSALSGTRLKYCDDYLLNIAGFNTTEKSNADTMKGFYKWQVLEYAKMPIYKAIVKDKDLNIEICIPNVSQSPFFQQVVEFIKKTENKKQK